MQFHYRFLYLGSWQLHSSVYLGCSCTPLSHPGPLSLSHSTSCPWNSKYVQNLITSHHFLSKILAKCTIISCLNYSKIFLIPPSLIYLFSACKHILAESWDIHSFVHFPILVAHLNQTPVVTSEVWPLATIAVLHSAPVYWPHWEACPRFVPLYCLDFSYHSLLFQCVGASSSWADRLWNFNESCELVGIIFGVWNNNYINV